MNTLIFKKKASQNVIDVPGILIVTEAVHRQCFTLGQLLQLLMRQVVHFILQCTLCWLHHYYNEPGIFAYCASYFRQIKGYVYLRNHRETT